MNAVLRESPTTFACETIATVFAEIEPLLRAHWAEIAHYPDIPLDPDYDRYAQAEHADRLRIYTARAGHKLIGYAIFLVGPAAHYRSSLQALQDILFLHPDYRHGGVGLRLIKYADAQLQAEGVQVVIQHVKKAHNFGPLLERLGYELQDLIFTRRLD